MNGVVWLVGDHCTIFSLLTPNPGNMGLCDFSTFGHRAKIIETTPFPHFHLWKCECVGTSLTLIAGGFIGIGVIYPRLENSWIRQTSTVHLWSNIQIWREFPIKHCARSILSHQYQRILKFLQQCSSGSRIWSGGAKHFSRDFADETKRANIGQGPGRALGPWKLSNMHSPTFLVTFLQIFTVALCGYITKISI